MPMLVSNCPRCRSDKMTFDVLSYNDLGTRYDWQRWYELFSICRHCHTSTVFVVSQNTGGDIRAFVKPSVVMDIKSSLNDLFRIERFISLRDKSNYPPPDFIPDDVKTIFVEGTVCLSLECWNAAGAMFRQCLDLATKSMLPAEDIDGVTKNERRNISPRLVWLFSRNVLQKDLESLASCIKEVGNDGVHDGNLQREDAFDLMDFTVALLERTFTEPARIAQAEARRLERKAARVVS